jgi:hypothetical protein
MADIVPTVLKFGSFNFPEPSGPVQACTRIALPLLPQISNVMKIHPVGAELFHADRRTDMANLMVAFRNFAKAPKKQIRIFLSVLS